MNLNIGILLFLLTLLHQPSSASYFQKNMMNTKRSSERAATQWTLADWLQQKKKIGLMDHWLLSNRKTQVFDFMFGGGNSKFLLKTESQTEIDRSWNQGAFAQTAFYVYMLGVEGSYEKYNPGRDLVQSSLNLRILGSHLQSTRLIVKYGFRELKIEEDQEKWLSHFAEADLNIYLFRGFGLQGRYQHIIPKVSNEDVELKGHRVSGGAFIELGVLRIFGEYFEEPLEFKNLQNEVSKELRQGYQIGALFYL